MNKKKAEEEKLERKLEKERWELEDRFKDEADTKKKKFSDVREANAKLADEKKKPGDVA